MIKDLQVILFCLIYLSTFLIIVKCVDIESVEKEEKEDRHE